MRRVLNELSNQHEAPGQRERQLEKTNGIVASGPNDYPPMSVVIDAALVY